ncbi:hypothetical protein [Acidisoma cladoniae]|uniref:hypothetical protein n=1 Tax=Acidisoma cladoniae TaxID=3040935 RepID=UPI002550700C|nr:hypothetical protein [Acidisoma sp. PAMC 29798]
MKTHKFDASLETVVFEGYTGFRNNMLTTSEGGVRIYRDFEDDNGWYEEAHVPGVVASDWPEALYRHVLALPQLPQELPAQYNFTAHHRASVDRMNRLKTVNS